VGVRYGCQGGLLEEKFEGASGAEGDSGRREVSDVWERRNLIKTSLYIYRTPADT